MLSDRRVVGRLRVPGLEAEHLDADLLGMQPEGVGDALAEGLVVVDHVDGLDMRELLEHVRGGRALVVVAGGQPGVVPLARRVVDLRLTGVVPRREVGQAHRRVGHAHHRHGATRGTVENGNDQLGAARVECPEHGDERLLRSIGPGVRGAFPRVPRTCLGGRVVATLVADRELSGLEVVLGRQDELDRLLHRQELCPPGPLQREIRRDQQLRRAGALVVQRAA